jgi:putative salt-induced outer membrane protein
VQASSYTAAALGLASGHEGTPSTMKFLTLALAALTFTLPVLAQADAQKSTWTGEGAFNAGFTTGNTETTDIGLGVKLARELGAWKASLDASADFGETNSVETRNRFLLGGQLERQFNDRLFGFGRVSYEQDKFSGFETRTFLGAGVGYLVLDREATKWTVEGGPGFRIDELAGSGATEESFAVRGASSFSHKFNDAVTFTNDTTVTWADVSTQTTNVAAVTAKLTDKLSGRLSFDVRNDSNPPAGFEQTDTATRVGIVYAIG